MSQIRTPYRVLAVCGLLLLAVGLVFGQTARFDFVNLDDDQYVYNSAETQLGLSAAGIAGAWKHSQVGAWHPLTTMSFMLDWQLFGMQAGGYHVHNVLLHAASSVLLFLLLRRMTGAVWLSAMAAALFAIHPLRAESVAWVTERKDVLSGLYFVLTLYAYAVYAARPSLLRYSAVLVLFALGLMCKAMLVTLPVIMLLLDYWPLERLGRPAGDSAERQPGARRLWLRRAPRLVAEKLPLFLLAAAFSAVTAHLTLSAERAVAVLPLRVRMAMAPVSAVTYLGQMFYPHNLSAHYPYSEDGPPAWQVVAACALLLAISAGVLAVCRSRPYLLVGWLWYLVTLLPVIGLVPGGNQLMADRYSYITHIGLYVALLWAAADLSASWPQRGRLGAAVSALVLVGLTTCAWRQTSYWRDSETLWRHALSCTSDNAIAHEHLGTALEQLARLAQEKNDYPLARDRIAEAKEHYQQALTIMPRSLPALCDLGNLLNEEGKVDEAIGLYQRAIAINSKLAAAHYNLGNALLHKGRVDDAIASYERALEFAPNFVQAHNNLANLLGEKGRTDEALDHYRQAIEASPGYAETYNNLGNALRRQGKIAEALTNYHRTLEIDPKHAGAYTSLGDVSRQNGQLDTAATYYQQALQADPRCLVACNNLGDILIRQGKIDEAIAVYRRAVEIAPQGAIIWYNLGVCLGQKGRLDETMVCYQKALGLASARNDKALADVIRAQIRLQQSVAPAGNAR